MTEVPGQSDLPWAPDGEEAEETQTSVDHAIKRASPPVYPYIFLFSGEQSGRLFRLSSRLTVGRGADADIAVTDPGVSRLHVSLSVKGETVLAVDQGSSNGTYLDGVRIQDSEVHDGDTLVIGHHTVLRILYVDANAIAGGTDREHGNARYDAVTGLFSADALRAELAEALAHSRQTQLSLSLLVVAVDRFDELCAALEPTRCRILLQEVAGRIQGVVRHDQPCARTGPNEVTILCRGAPGSIAKQIATRARQALEGLPEEAALQRIWPLTLSCGIVTVMGRYDGDETQLLAEAAALLTQATAAGGDRVMAKVLDQTA